MGQTVLLGMMGHRVRVKEQGLAADATLVVDLLNNVVLESAVLCLVVRDAEFVNLPCVNSHVHEVILTLTQLTNGLHNIFCVVAELQTR